MNYIAKVLDKASIIQIPNGICWYSSPVPIQAGSMVRCLRHGVNKEEYISWRRRLIQGNVFPSDMDIL